MAMDVGEIKAGKLADILLIDGNPTADVAILEDKDRMPVVMKDGLFHRNELLQSRGGSARL
jgi:imidazolonepropionase-like amidohydrolase